MTQEKEFMAFTQISGRQYRSFDRQCAKKAYETLLKSLKKENVRVSKRTTFYVRQIDYDPSHNIITFSIIGDWSISGKKEDIELELSKTA